jgi:hypothetical protein
MPRHEAASSTSSCTAGMRNWQQQQQQWHRQLQKACA